LIKIESVEVKNTGDVIVNGISNAKYRINNITDPYIFKND